MPQAARTALAAAAATTRHGGDCSRTSTTTRTASSRCSPTARQARPVAARVVVAADRGAFRCARSDARGRDRRRARRAAALVPGALLAALAERERYAAANLAASAGEAEHRRRILRRARRAAAFRRRRSPRSRAWHALADWLLVAGEARFRNPVADSGGLSRQRGTAPAPPSAASATTAMTGAARRARGHRRTRGGARRRAPLPPPRYADDTWAIVDALLDILPRVAAQLTLAFRDAGAIDFTQAHARRARRAGRRRTRRPTCCCGSTFGSTSAGRRVPGHVVRAARPDPAADGRLEAGRRAHAVRRRRSDAVDLPLPRRRGAALRRGAGDGADRRRAGREPRPAPQFPLAGGPRRLGQRRLPAACWARAAIPGAASSRFAPAVAAHDARPGPRSTLDVVGRCASRGAGWSSGTSRRRSRRARRTSPCSCARARISTRSCRRCAPRASRSRRSSSTRWPSGRRCWTSSR